MRIDDPWKAIPQPTETNRISARRIPNAGSHAWGLYWAVDGQRHCLLILQHRSTHRTSHRLPRLKGLQVEVQPTEDDSGERLIVRLTDGELREIFHRFCVDIVDATSRSQSEDEAIDRFLVRTWRWHRLLKGGGDGRLSEEEQKGLIGELHLLERLLLPAAGAADAVQAWMGPLGAPKDFQLGWISVEAKTRTPQISTIRISSANQLDSNGATRLFLHVTQVSRAASDTASAPTISDIAARTRDTIASLDMSATVLFEERLNATGFDWNDDYSDRRWLIGTGSLYEVREGFPRITPAMIPSGVDDVRYMIALAQCDGFRVAKATLAEALAGEGDGN